MSRLKLFEAIGVELEYMIVRRDTLDVYPVADKVLGSVAGESVGYVELDNIAWSNELVLHVIELKTNGPVEKLQGVAQLFAEHIKKINAILEGIDGCLMPAAAHPWMDPVHETRLWPHECGPVYQAYNKIFDCRGHGWSNLQSIHINLPFAGDEEFGRLHAAVRLLMPIMPALTASSPILDGAKGSHLDNRMKYYCNNSARIPVVGGKIIPEQAYTEKQYREQIFAPMYRAIAPFDPQGILTHEFLNSRGAIARFDRGAIEIRVLDIQETPAADLAAAQLIIAALQSLTIKALAEKERLMAWKVEPLARIFQSVIQNGDQAIIRDAGYLALFGITLKKATALDLWRHIASSCLDVNDLDASMEEALSLILDAGPLARRILGAAAGDFRHQHLYEIYRHLCACLAENRLFVPDLLT